MAFHCPWTLPNRRRPRHSLLLRNDQHCPLPSPLLFTEFPSSKYVSYVTTSKWGPVSSPPTCPIPTRSLAFQIPEGTKPFPRLKASQHSSRSLPWMTLICHQTSVWFSVLKKALDFPKLNSDLHSILIFPGILSLLFLPLSQPPISLASYRWSWP